MRPGFLCRNPGVSGRSFHGFSGFRPGEKRPLSAVLLLLIWVFGVSALAGCVSRQMVVPVSLPLLPNTTEAFKGGSPIRIVNAQDDRKEVIIRPESFGVEYYGVMYDWTQAAADLLKSELNKRDIPVVPHAQKKLMLRVVNVQLYFKSRVGSGPIYVRLNLEVKANSVPLKIFEGSYSESSLDNAAGGAVTGAVAALLRDPTLIDFIKQ